MIDRLRVALSRCQKQFTTYAQNHRDKVGTKVAADTPEAADTLEKAAVNEAFASWIGQEISVRSPDELHAEMVAKLQKPGDAIIIQMTPKIAATLHMGVGVCTEAGELLDALKKWAFYGKLLDLNNVIEELGDIEFYLAGIRQNLEISRDQTLVENMDKLGVRYEGHNYSDEAAILRADKQVEQLDGFGAAEGLLGGNA